ncbi:unnamed protein product [Pleuronectes platessa]|uniref:Uncharacterized protein n=1 Tax=Pleuronectes platessa TaxID=8262 RepID=A0A9N7U446_PLEPL|nr:unnamed protein product [Pleuronectes platessa]
MASPNPASSSSSSSSSSSLHPDLLSLDTPLCQAHSVLNTSVCVSARLALVGESRLADETVNGSVHKPQNCREPLDYERTFSLPGPLESGERLEKAPLDS